MKIQLTQQTGHVEVLDLDPIQAHVLTEKMWNEYCKAEEAGKPTALAFSQGHKILCALFYGSAVVLQDAAPARTRKP